MCKKSAFQLKMILERSLQKIKSFKWKNILFVHAVIVKVLTNSNKKSLIKCATWTKIH